MSLAASKSNVGLRIYLNHDYLNDFHGMVMADILAMSPSSFSRLASLYSFAEKVYYFPSHECEAHGTPLGCNQFRNNANRCPGEEAMNCALSPTSILNNTGSSMKVWESQLPASHRPKPAAKAAAVVASGKVLAASVMSKLDTKSQLDVL